MTEQQEKQQEQQRVNFVSGQIREQIETNRQLLEAAHRETRAVEQNYSDNASVNNYEADDTTDTIANIEEQRQLVARANESEMILKRQLDTMTNLAG